MNLDVQLDHPAVPPATVSDPIHQTPPASEPAVTAQDEDPAAREPDGSEAPPTNTFEAFGSFS